MIFHIFNSSLISGPETLVLPALVKFPQPVQILLLREKRIAAAKQNHVEDYLCLPVLASDLMIPVVS